MLPEKAHLSWWNSVHQVLWCMFVAFVEPSTGFAEHALVGPITRHSQTTCIQMYDDWTNCQWVMVNFLLSPTPCSDLLVDGSHWHWQILVELCNSLLQGCGPNLVLIQSKFKKETQISKKIHYGRLDYGPRGFNVAHSKLNLCLKFPIQLDFWWAGCGLSRIVFGLN